MTKQTNPQSSPADNQVPEKLSRSAVRDQILSSFKQRTGSDASNFMDRLGQQAQETASQKPTLEIPLVERSSFVERSMITLVDQIFDHFQNYIYEFSRSQVGSHLHVLCERPTITREVLSYGAWREPKDTSSLFKGWLTTAGWTLIVRGTIETIEAFIVPSEKAIAITRTQTHFHPELVLQSECQSGKVFWKRDGQIVSIEQLQSITEELFLHLINFAMGNPPQEPRLTDAFMLAAPPPAVAPRETHNSYAEQFFATETTTTPSPTNTGSSAMTLTSMGDLLLKAIDQRIVAITDSNCSAQHDPASSQTKLANSQKLASIRERLSTLLFELTSLNIS